MQAFWPALYRADAAHKSQVAARVQPAFFRKKLLAFGHDLVGYGLQTVTIGDGEEYDKAIGKNAAAAHIFFAPPQKGGKGALVFLTVGLYNALGHGKIKVRHALAAVHLVLVCLNGDARERGVAADVVRLSQIAVACGKSVLKQL